MSATAALILQIEGVLLAEAIARCMPVWIADSPNHAPLKNFLKAAPFALPVTWFPLKEEESLEAAVVRIVFSLDDHYNGSAQKDGYKFLLVFGARFEASMAVDLEELDFRSFESTDFGFIASK